MKTVCLLYNFIDTNSQFVWLNSKRADFMKWNPFILGMLGDPYTSNILIFPLLGIVGFLLCYFKYKLAWLVIPINSIVCAVFLNYFFTPENYLHISLLAPKLIPVSVIWMCFSVISPLVGAVLNKRKSKIRLVNLP